MWPLSLLNKMKNRILYLDVLRSFAMIMVILLHSISDYIVRPELYGTVSWYANLCINAISRTGVPVFFMVSGMLMLSSDGTRDIKKFYKKSLIRIGIPLLLWNVIYFIYKCAMGYISFDIVSLFRYIINNGTEYHLWYLYTLIGIYLIAPFLKRIVDSCNTKEQIWLLFLMLLCTSIRPFVNQLTQQYVYLFEPLFNGYIAFFFMGYILSNIKINRRILFSFSIIGLVGFVISVVFHHINSSKVYIDLIFNSGYSLCHCALAASVFVIIRYVFEKLTFFSGVASFLSKYSFGVYLVHVLIIDLVLNYLMIDASPIVSSMYIFAVAILLSLAVSFLLGKVKYLKKAIGL